MVAKQIPNLQDGVRFLSTLPERCAWFAARALTNGDGCRRRLASPAKKPSRSVTEHLHQCPRSTMAVLSLGMGADRVRFSARAQAVTTARCPRAVPVVTAVQCGYFSRREAGLPSRASRVRISVPALVARPSSKRCSGSKSSEPRGAMRARPQGAAEICQVFTGGSDSHCSLERRAALAA